jgi:hypothetical protein
MFWIDSQKEYDAFRRWFYNGSTLEQRMSSGSDQEKLDPPETWLEIKKLLVYENRQELPETLAEYEAMVQNEIDTSGE